MAFNVVQYVQAAYRNSPWVVISVGVHIVLIAVLSFFAFKREVEREDVPIAVAISPSRDTDQIEEPLPEPEQFIDRKAVPGQTEGDEETFDEDEYAPVEMAPPTSEDERQSTGDPYALEMLPPGMAGGTSIAAGTGPGHYSAGTSPFASTRLGGGVGGKYGGRFGRPGGGGTGIEQALSQGLDWLKFHQSADGRWGCATYVDNCGKIGSNRCEGIGLDTHDVGMTGLALLAFLGDGNTTRGGPYREVVARGVGWLKDVQNPDTGMIGPQIGRAFLYDHSIATLALCEAYYFAPKTAVLKRVTQPAINLITRARNPYGAWRYDLPPTGANDTSVTGWMVFALKAAEEANLQIDPEAFQGALSWIDEVTDQTTGRVGYDSVGSASSRVDNYNRDFPTDRAEAMTAVGLLCRIFLGQTPDKHPIMNKHADLMLKRLPEWDPVNKGSDFYYWYYGTYAMFQMGGKYWESWKKAMETAVVKSQCGEADGDEKGSWDPIDPWCYAGGRVYATASLTLCLEVYFRYAKVLGAR